MKIFDMHIHAFNTKESPEKLLQEMKQAGIDGGCVFSNWPKRANAELGTDFDTRLNEVLSWTKGHEDRLFPVLWIHPYEENIIENIHIAVKAGIAAFKMICTDFYVYEEECLDVLKEIASLNKPVFFHSGILWDGQVSSQYNRPLNWEALLTIKGLRFSMGHCSWPWIDECIAMYGKFMNAKTVRADMAEMFFDITPGTPEIYRRELLTKLYTIGYDVGDNVMFGTDSSAHTYSHEWPSKWLKLDGEIMDDLGISEENRQKLYADNLLRFLGKSTEQALHLAPTPDNDNRWSAENPIVKGIIRKWYEALRFPKQYDAPFYKALAEIPVTDTVTTFSPSYNTENGLRNLLNVLYLCEKTKEEYEKRGIPESILMDTLSDIVIWTNTWSNLKGGLYLCELGWLQYHLRASLFRLGRLQFCMGKAECDIPEANLKEGDPVIEVHIPEGKGMSREACVASIAEAKKFFATYFPEYEYRGVTCHSWLLDPTLAEVLKPESNILAFQSFFKVVKTDPSISILRYTLRWDASLENYRQIPATSSLAEKAKERIGKGGSFYIALGYIPLENFK